MSEPVNGVAVLERPATNVATARQRGVVRASLGFLRGTVPTVLVLALAGAVGWYGHRTGWKLPKFADLAGHKAAADDWCGEHSVPESLCVECNPDLLSRPKDHGWCKVHGVHECPLCHPELAQLAGKATVTPADLDRAKRSLAFTDRPQNNPVCKLHQRRLQFADAQAVGRAGVDIEPVWTAPVVEFVAAPGEVGYDQTRVAHLSSRSPGTVWKVFKHLGQEAKAGEVLALIDAAEVGKAKAELLQASATLQLKVQTVASIKESGGAVPAARVREAEAAVGEAEIRLGAGCQTLTNLGLPLDEAEVRTLAADQLKARLRLLGIPADVAKTLDPKSATTNLLPLVAPMDGTVVSREVVPGEVVDVNRILFEVVDTRSLWITFEVKGEDALRVRVGQPVRFKPDNSREELVGTVAWRSTQADPKTRTVKVRADLADPNGRQLANTFGAGRVILREEAQAVVVPNAAVHWEGCCHIVFVRDKDFLKADAPKVFHTRTVRIGAKDEKHTEVIAGVLLGELVAVKNSGVLRAELLRGNLGEG